MNWLHRHSNAIQALAALLTCVLALVALIGVKFQVDAASKIQREQSAKEIYRELLNLSIANPEYASPDYCALKQSPKFTAYESYVDYLLYTSEQVIDMDPAWIDSMEKHLAEHVDYLCSQTDDDDNAPDVAEMLRGFKSKFCKGASAC
jgi:hypothetical protein